MTKSMERNASEYLPCDYWQERLSRDFSLGSVGILGLGKVFNRWLYEIRKLAVNRALSEMRIKVEGQSVLDVGCGTGFWLEYWRKRSAQIAGIDITEVSIRKLREAFPDVTLYQDDIGRPGLELGKRFDLVSAFEVLYHITDHHAWVLALENITRHLKPGGWLIITDIFLHEGEYRIYHQVSRPLSEYERYLSRFGLKILGRFPVFVFAHYPHDARGITRKILELGWYLQVTSLAAANRVGVGRMWGNLLGSFMFLVEGISTRLCREGPTLELMVCKKPEAL